MRLKTNTFLFPFILVVLFFTIGLYFFNKIENLNTKVAQLSIPRVISTLELEININEAYNSILDYTNHTQEILKEKDSLAKYYDSVKDFEEHLAKYFKLSDSLNSDSYSRELQSFYIKFKKISEDLIAVDKIQKVVVKDRRDLLNKNIEKELDEFLQLHLSELDKEYAKKLQALDEIEINIHELISAVRGYLIRHDNFLFERIDDSKGDLVKWAKVAKSLNFIGEDKIQLDQLLINIDKLMLMSDKIIQYELQKTKLLKQYNQVVNKEFDVLIDDIVELNILTENEKLLEEQSSTIKQAILSIFIYSIIAIIFVYYMARSHSKKEENEIKLMSDLKDSLDKTTAINEELNQQFEYADKILNTQTNLTIVTDGKNLKKANQAMLNFFGYQTLQEFVKEHTCICDFFIEEKGFLTKEYNGKTWFQAIMTEPDKTFYVKIKNIKGELHIFEIIRSKNAIITKAEKLYVITLNDVTMHLDFTNQLSHKVKSQLEEIRKKDFTILEQAKMVALGDMIGNIAHQWRQPLSVISTGASGLNLKSQFNEELKPKEIEDTTNKIVEQTKYLSETIDVFRDFIKEEKAIKEVVLQDRIDKALNIVNASIKSTQIKVINNIDYSNPIKIKLVVGELTQVLINILNNAKDALDEKEIQNPWIKIELEQNNDLVIISIEDNAGGIPNEILPKIFEPYFTTKHQSQGTGLGLHMCYKIIIESLKGELYAKNTQNGAKFFIELPLTH